eukprot:CAMPEP_0180686476 /NCGR_PEP_ID=MMETSP1037_2-20121125/72949_1 /TAXON_ID=632150 /ORGANISM="Azadinium spinosum, Strain 3D9" /LENGTH=77 /DNA_ID=CAMNT_0022717215 /DNA_START=764 /DNA_END=997 /DNA_ORIENTATION=-
MNRVGNEVCSRVEIGGRAAIEDNSFQALNKGGQVIEGGDASIPHVQDPRAERHAVVAAHVEHELSLLPEGSTELSSD